MKDLVSKVTFGFIMAQLVPGAIALLSITYAVFLFMREPPGGVLSMLGSVVEFYSADGPRQVIFFVLAVASGMLIHGINWGVIGSLEGGSSPTTKTSVFDSFWHDWALGLQIAVGPIKLVGELFRFLCVKGIRSAGVRENVPRIQPTRIEHLALVQDFYLSFSQFYLHSSYAVGSLLVAVGLHVVVSGCTLRMLFIAAALYLLVGLLFVLGRIQLHSLFNAEEELAEVENRLP